MSAGARRLDDLCAYVDARASTLDVVLLAGVTIVALALRLALLGSVPYGLHPDEAQVGTDVHRILDTGWIGVYTAAALGQPAGHAYLTLPSIWALGDTAFALRLPLALVATLAVPLLYLLVRVSYGRAEAFFASALLSVSYWHLLYSRVAHWSISYGTVTVGVLFLLMLGINTRRIAWFAGAGFLFGLGAYTYNIYPIAAAAVAAFLLAMTAIHVRGDAWRAWLRSLAVFAAVAFVVALPMIKEVADEHSLYRRHFRTYEGQRVTSLPEYRRADFDGKVGLLAGQAKIFASRFAWDSEFDYVDGNGLRPMFDLATLTLILAGVVMAAQRWREPMVLAAACCVAIIPLPAVLQTQSVLRQPVAAAPFVMFFAALPLAAAWRYSMRGTHLLRLAPAALALAALGYIAIDTGFDYFQVWARNQNVRHVYFSEMTSASIYMRQLPPGTYVYLYSERAPLWLEMRRYLAPDLQGEDRSIEYSDKAGSIEGIDRSRPVAFVLMGPYANGLDRVVARYPGGEPRGLKRDSKLEFVAYELPAASP